MNKNLLFITALSIYLSAFTGFAKAQNISFGDPKFKTALIFLGVDTNSDGEISQQEAKAVINLNVSVRNISSLQGIEYFVNLETLNCAMNNLTSLDVSGNPHLKDLNCEQNKLTSLNVSNNSELQILHCGAGIGSALNDIANLDLSSCVNLLILSCDYNALTQLDLSHNPLLQQMVCNNNPLLTSLDLSHNPDLTVLWCYANKFTSLDVSHNTKLKTLRCDDNNLTSLDITNNPDITFLNCSFNKIRTLFMKNGNDNLSGSFAFSNPYLEFVCCNESQLEQVKEALEFYGHDLGITVATSDCLLSICP